MNSSTAESHTENFSSPLENAVRLWKTETLRESSPFAAWLFTDTKEAAAEAKKYMGQPFLADRITTLPAFALQLVRTRCPELTFITLNERIIIFEALAKKIGFMQKIHVESGTAESVKDTIPLNFITHLIGRYNFFRLNKITIGRKTAKHAAVSDLFEAYETYCREHHLADSIVIFEKAIELLRQEETEAPKSPAIEKSVIFGIRHPEKLIEELLTEIRKRDHIEIADEPAEELSPSAEETVSLICKNRESEAEQILERAAELIEAGVSPSEILIITPSGAETAQLISEMAGEFYAELPVSGDLEGENSGRKDSEGEVRRLQVTEGAFGAAIAAHPVIQCVLSVLHAESSGYTIDDLEQILSSPYLKAPDSYGIKGALTAGMLEQISAAFGTDKGGKEWLRIAELIAEKSREEAESEAAGTGYHKTYRRFEAAAAEIPLLLSWIQGVSDAASKTFRGRADALLQWLEAAGWTEPQTDAAASSAQKAFLEYLISISGTVTGDYRCSAQEFYSHISRYAMSNRMNVWRNPAECIHITNLRKAAGLRAEYVFLTGLEAEHLPAADRVLSPFTAAETAELVAPLKRDTGQEEKERFVLALAAAQKRLYLSYAASDGKKQLVPSVFLTEFMERAAPSAEEPREIRHSVRRNRIRAGRALRCPEKCGAALSGAAGLPDAASVIRRIKAAETEPGVFEGDAKEIFSKSYGVGSLYLSPTSIETYLKCPYKWYLEKHLRLFTPSDIDSFVLRKGNVVHAVLEEFVKTYGKPVTDENIDDAYTFIRRIAREKFDAEKINTPGWTADAAWYCDDVDDDHGHYRPLYAFLKHEAELARDGWEAWKSRTEYDVNGVVEKDGFSFRYSGKIDRVVERDAKGSDGKVREFRIIDYKTGTPPKDDGTAVQLPLYAAAYSRASGGSPDDGYYYQIGVKKIGKSSFKKNGELFDSVISRGLENAASAAAGIRGAQLRPMPAEGACEYCPYKRFCKSAVKSSWGGA